MRKKAMRLMYPLVVMALITAACSSSGGAGGASTPTTAGTPAQSDSTSAPALSSSSSPPASGTSGAPGGSTTSGTAAAPGGGNGFTLNVGNVLPFTGDLSNYGPSLDKASQLGADMVNEALAANGSTNIKIAIVGSEDDQTSASAGVEAATKLVTSDHAQVLIGSMSSGVTIAIAQSVAIPQNVLMLTPTSSDPSISDLKDNGLVFRVYPPDDFQAKALAEAMADQFGKTAKINVGGRNDAFGVSLVKAFSQQWVTQGGTIGQTVMYNPSAATFDSDAAQLTSGNPDGWMIADFPPTFAKMGPALVRTGAWKPDKTFMTEAMQNADALAKIGGPATDGLRGTAASSAGGTDPDAFQKLFKEKESGVPFTGFEATAFDSVVIAALAAIKAGTSDPSEVKKALLTVSRPDGEKFTWQQLPEAIKAIQAGKTINYQGAWTQVAFDDKGDPLVGTFVLWQYQNGKINTLKTFTFQS